MRLLPRCRSTFPGLDGERVRCQARRRHRGTHRATYRGGFLAWGSGWNGLVTRAERPGVNGEDYTCPICGATAFSFYGEPITPDGTEHDCYWYRVGAGQSVCFRCAGSPLVLASERWHKEAEQRWLATYELKAGDGGSPFNPSNHLLRAPQGRF